MDIEAGKRVVMVGSDNAELTDATASERAVTTVHIPANGELAVEDAEPVKRVSRSLERRRTTISQLAARNGASVKFHDISYKVGGQPILKNVNGSIEKGEVLALMGPSG